MVNNIKGRAIVLGDNVDTDQIIPAKYLNTSEPDKLAPHFMENEYPDLAANIMKGDIIVAGKNFGSGSSREHAVITIKGLGISCIIAESFARIFFRNAINTGIPVIEAKIEATEYGEISIDFDKSIIMHNGITTQFKKYPEFLRNIIDSKGLVNYVRSGKW
ncbi:MULTISPECIES: 3-isopropylmalate dehydratase small subunit [Ferroplasma]|uniref:3-isopropylmalate dehydratase small subunit n=2 Tax=Ferroplasma TaxID=74968 RepID=S0APU7_FERAC|nr:MULTISPECIES: 3-isopropylmalate dehydratase small subunit [Ferroplasma]AGO60931.1 3-isopropylmalate dehydratase small subunit [Ferroplasma acidarmanus Fer1]NOL60557.1 3-isopropylmalate dehydratase [Ferroplasma acidiphilum]WMT52810.1 MAG: 3-isopropylmalate dehydratase [Ferroplasma acidiphilum]